jgi:hypothetical protein
MAEHTPENVTVSKLQLDAIVDELKELRAERQKLFTDFAEMREGYSKIGTVLIFIKDQFLGGEIPSGEGDFGLMFFAKLSKNIASFIFNIKKNPEQFTSFTDALQAILALAPKYLNQEQIKNLTPDEFRK